MITFVLCGYVFYVLSKNDSRKNKYVCLLSIAAVLEVLDIRGPIVPLGESLVISRSGVFEIILWLYSLYYIKVEKIKINPYFMTGVYLFIFFALVGLTYESLIPYENPIIDHYNELSWDGYAYGLTSKTPAKVSWSWSIFMLFKLSIVLVQLVIIKSILKKDDLLSVLRKMDRFIYYAIVYAVVEMTCKLILNIPNISDAFSNILFFTNDYEGMRDESYALVGVGPEPSVLARYLFLAVIIAYFRKKYDDIYGMTSYYCTVIVALLLMILSKSAASYWLMTMMFVLIYVIKKQNKKYDFKKIIIRLLVFVSLLSMLIWAGGNWLDSSDSYAAYRINRALYTLDYITSTNVLSYNYGGESSLARLGSIYDVFCDFLERPVLGLGAGVQISHGGISSFLCEYGLVGLVIWLGLMFRKTREKRISIMFFMVWFFIMNLPLRMGNLPYDIYPLVIFEMTCLSRGTKNEELKC